MKSVIETFLLIVFLITLGVLVTHFGIGCASVKESVAEATFLGQQLECVNNLETKRDIDACRNSVRRKWGKPERDGGAE